MIGSVQKTFKTADEISRVLKSPFYNNRRHFLSQLGGGFGALALSDILARAAEIGKPRPEFNGGLHHPAKARRIIQLFMNGGASQIDTYDYKPELIRLHGQMLGP